ncbi:MAG: 50S ribosomal protein L20 [Myxococcota bacterium]
MARIKRAQIRKRRIKKLFRRSKGFFLARNNTIRQTTEAVIKARTNAYVGRKQRKRHFRRLWITRISAATKMHGLSYSRLIHGLDKANIQINRKMLSELAIHDQAAFGALVERAREALAA